MMIHMQFNHQVLLLALCWPSLVSAITLKEGFQRCQDVPREGMNSCIVRLINDLKPLIGEGIPELGLGAGPIDVPDLSFDDTYGDNYVRTTLSHGKVKGLQEFDVHDIKLDYEAKSCSWKVFFPEYMYSGRYLLDAQFYFFPLRGNGTGWIRMNDVVLNGVTRFEVQQEVEGEAGPRLQETDSIVTFSYGNLALRLNNLFDGDPILQEAGLAFISSSKDDIVEEMRPSIDRSFAQVGSDIVNPILAKIELKDIAGHQYL